MKQFTSIQTNLYGNAALFTQRIGLNRLSWYCARKAGFFGEPEDQDEEFERVAGRIEHWAYMQGYRGKVPPRVVRKLFAKSTLHRAWLAGHMGVFEQAGFRFGVTNRSNFHYRT